MGCKAVQSILSISSNKINTLFNITLARVQDSTYHLILKSHFKSKRQDFTIGKRGVFVDVYAYICLPCLLHFNSLMDYCFLMRYFVILSDVTL